MKLLRDPEPAGLEKSFLCQSQNCLGCQFSGRIFFHLGRNRAPRLQRLGAKKEAMHIFEAIFWTHPDTNIINEMIARSFSLATKIDEKHKIKKKERKEKETTRKIWAHFILMKQLKDGVGVLEQKQIKSLQVEQKEKE